MDELYFAHECIDLVICCSKYDTDASLKNNFFYNVLITNAVTDSFTQLVTLGP